MLLNKRLEDVTWDDVQAFCALQLVESAVLDYKQAFPARLESTIAAMANTIGGAIIIGVAENAQGRPQAPFEGVAFERGLAERVQNILTAHVQPLLDVGVAVPTNSDGSRAFVVVRIPQSPLAPHTVDGTAIYVRTGNRNHPEQQATVDQIEWLLNNRSRAVALRRTLIEQALRRCFAMGEVEGVILTLCLCPTFPSEAFLPACDLMDVYGRIRVPDYFYTDHSYPIGANIRTVQDGVVSITVDERAGAFWYAELNVHGLYLTRQALQQSLRNLDDPHDDEDADQHSRDRIRASEIVARVDEFARSALTFFQAIAYPGPLEFSFSIENANRCLLDTRINDGEWLEGERECPDPEIKVGLQANGMALASERQRMIFASMERLAAAFNTRFDPARIARFVEPRSRVPLEA
jgi:hypothetical protein